MVGRNYEYGSTSRTYSKAEIEKKRLGAIIKRAGYKGGAAEVLRLLDSPGRSVLYDAYRSLQRETSL